MAAAIACNLIRVYLPSVSRVSSGEIYENIKDEKADVKGTRTRQAYPSDMIKFLHLPINAPKGVFLVTKTTSLSHPSFVVSVRLVLAPWSVLSGNDAAV